MKLLRKMMVSALVALCIFATSCKNYDEEISNIKTEMEAMKTTLASLQNAYNEGKAITSVTPIEGVNDWQITFSDNTSITITSGKDGVDGQKGNDGATPYVKVDDKNYWVVSYDNGKTYTTLLDTNGNPIVAKGDKGDTGEDGNSVRVVVGEDLYYVIEVYNPTTGNVVDRIVSPYSSNPQNAIKSIVENEAAHTITITMESGDVYVFAKADILGSVQLTRFSFLAENNARNLLYDVEFDISDNYVVSCFIPYILGDRNFVPTFECNDAKLIVNDKEVISGETRLDCSLPLELKLVSDREIVNYTLIIKYFTGLPIVYIDTEDKKSIDSKDDYVKGTIRVISNSTDATPDFESAMKIKGRGNSTWQLPKKPYKIKFDSKVSLLGEPADKEWVLLANYTDKTQLRNEIAFYMGEMSLLEYTPRTNFVEVVLNGVYNGTYQLGEQLKIAKNRVNVGDDGYLMEIDAKAEPEDITFMVTHIGYPINIKDPDVETNSEAYNYVVNYLEEADKALFSTNFTDPNEGYAKYLDVQSFVDWYVINEIAKNNDAIFYTSCYMHLAKDGKLKMGPLWDYDIAFGNINYNGNDSPEGFYIKENVSWYSRLFQDPTFVQLVKDRFAYFYDKQDVIFTEINRKAEYLQYAAVENNFKWGTLYQYTWPNSEVLGSYQNEVQYLKSWLNSRFEWLNTAMSAL